MKLPIPKINLKLPALPFRRRGPEAEVEIGPAGPGKLGRILRLAGTGLLAIGVIGGLGAVIGWLAVNGPDTIAERDARRPVLTVPILAEGEQPEPNSSLDAMAARQPEGHGGMAAGSHGDAAGQGAPAGSSDGHGAPTEPMAPEQQGPRFELALVEETEKGMLPIVAPDGRKAWEVYAKPFEAEASLPRIAIIMTRMGISRSLTAAAIEVLPPEVSFSFSTTISDLDDQVALAQKAGHEVFLDVPMEPFGYPANDPGPTTLLTSLSAVDNLNRLETVLGRTVGYAGVIGVKGSQFTTDEEALTPVLSVLKERGLMYVDSAATSRTIAFEIAGSLQLPRAVANWRIDDSPALAELQRRLSALERTAQRSGYALGVVPPLPITIDLLASWAATLPERGLVLAPVTALANKQSLR